MKKSFDALHAALIASTGEAKGSPLLRDFEFPLEETDQLDKLEESLKDASCRGALLKVLINIGGCSGKGNATKLCSRLLDSILKPELQIQYSWKGIQKQKNAEAKRAFINMTGIIQTIFEALLKADATHSENANELILQKLIKNAKSRTEQAKMKNATVRKGKKLALSNDAAVDYDISTPSPSEDASGEDDPSDDTDVIEIR